LKTEPSPIQLAVGLMRKEELVQTRKTIKLLVVDEQDGYCDLIREHAEICSHHVDILCECVNTGKEAIEKIASWKPSVILLDAHLRDVNSFEVLESCREGRATVVVSSDFCSREIMDSARDHGASGYVTKSESPEEIEALLFELASVSAPIELDH
jgi:DNA-binding NarL/FixJ family response regulator